MGLTGFKKNLKIVSAVSFLLVYGASFYLLGKNTKNLDIIFDVKNNTAKKNLEKPIESAAPFSDTQSGSVISSFVKLCSNTSFGFEVTYPKDWFTTYNTEEQKCTLFAPYSFVVPSDTTNFFTTVKIDIIKPQDWNSAVKFYENPNDYKNIISTENIQLNGKAVKKIEATTTGNSQLEKGLLNTTYLVFDVTKPLVLSYQQQEKNEDTDSNKKILEEMAASLNYF